MSQSETFIKQAGHMIASQKGKALGAILFRENPQQFKSEGKIDFSREVKTSVPHKICLPGGVRWTLNDVSSASI
jgi:hypothetical protein